MRRARTGRRLFTSERQDRMRAVLRFGIAILAALLACAPAAAQNSATNTQATNTPATDAIGPRELRDFSLNGTVTRTAPAEPARPVPAPARPAPRAEAPARAPAQDLAPARPSAEESARAAPSVTVPLPPPTAADGSGAPAPEPPPAFTTQPSLAPPIIPEAATLPAEQGGSLLPWLLLAMLLAGGAAYYAWRQQSRTALAGQGAALEAFIPAEPRPETLARAPAPRAAPPASPAPTIVSTRLRPQVEIELLPGRCVFDQNGARIEFEVGLLNAGSAPARDVLLEACMFNAGPAQDKEIEAFFEHPVGTGNRVAILPPLKRLAFKSAAGLSLDQMKAFEVAGRKLFVPLLGFNALYRWSGGEGQTSASYLIGRDTKAEKLAPFRVDMGPKLFRDLGAREHHVRVRK